MESMNRIEFGLRLREERQRLQLSTQQLAELGGVARVSQSHYEVGRSLPDAAYLSAVHVAGVNIGYLLTGSRAALQRFDWTLHDELLKGIDAWLDEHGMTLPFDKKMLVLRHLVEHAHENGAAPDTTTMAQILRIAA